VQAHSIRNHLHFKRPPRRARNACKGEETKGHITLSGTNQEEGLGVIYGRGVCWYNWSPCPINIGQPGMLKMLRIGKTRRGGEGNVPGGRGVRTVDGCLLERKGQSYSREVRILMVNALEPMSWVGGES